MDYKDRKRWRKPKLIILVKGNPQEAILQICKGGTIGSPLVGQVPCADNCTYCSFTTDT